MVLTVCMRDTMQQMIAALPLPVHPSPGETTAFGEPHSLPLSREFCICGNTSITAPLPVPVAVVNKHAAY